MACDPRCLSWYSDDPTAHDCRSSNGHEPRHLPDDPIAETRRDIHTWEQMSPHERAAHLDHLATLDPCTGDQP